MVMDMMLWLMYLVQLLTLPAMMLLLLPVILPPSLLTKLPLLGWLTLKLCLPELCPK